MIDIWLSKWSPGRILNGHACGDTYFYNRVGVEIFDVTAHG